MADTTSPPTRRVKLKHVMALHHGDAIQPGLGLFSRDGSRIVSALAMSDTWGRGVWFVTGRTWMNDWPEACVPMVDTTSTETASDILHAPLDAWVVLVGEEGVTK